MSLKSPFAEPSPRDLRYFAILQVGFVALCLFVLFRDSVSATVQWTAMCVSGVVAFVGAGRPHWISPIYRLWMLLVFPIGWVISHVCLAVVYYFVVTPVGWWRRFRSPDPLGLKIDPTATTYWEARVPVTNPQRYFRQY